MGSLFSEPLNDPSKCQSWVTLATNDSYALGGFVLSHSLRRVKTTRRLTIMITQGVSPFMRARLESVFDEIINVDPLDSYDSGNLGLLDRPELGITFTKLNCWKLTQFTKCVFLDADTMVLKNCDELFERDELSAVADPGWPDCFNSGLFVFRPSLETFQALLQHALQNGSFDGGDQGLLNTFFSSWPSEDISKHLSFIYNMCATSTYTYLPAFKHFGHNIKIVHFIGPRKPWNAQLDESGQPESGMSEFLAADYLNLWWKIHNKNVNQGFPVQEIRNPSLEVERERTLSGQVDWENGRPDFRGRASFDNILKTIEENIRDQ